MSCMPDARADGVVFGLRSGGSPSVNRQVQSAGAGLLSPALDLSVLSSLPAEAALGPPGGQRLRQLHLGSLIVWRTMCEQFEGSEVPSSRKSKQIRLGAGASVRGEHPVLAWRLGQGSLRVGAARGAGRGRARGSGGVPRGDFADAGGARPRRRADTARARCLRTGCPPPTTRSSGTCTCRDLFDRVIRPRRLHAPVPLQRLLTHGGLA